MSTGRDNVILTMAGGALPPGAVVVTPQLTFPDALNGASFQADDAPRIWVEGGLVQEGFLTLISGPPKARKSFLLQDLAVALAGAGGWLGNDCREQARVLLVDLELNAHYLQRRIERIRDDSGDAGGRIGDRLAVLPWRHASIQPGATASAVLKAIEAEADKHAADVVLIDSVYLLLDGDESDPVKVGELLRNLILLCKKRAVVFTHHYAKGSAQAQAAKSAIDRASGSSWWSRFADVLIPLTPPVLEPGEEKRTLLDVEPSIRHHAGMPPFTIEWTDGPRFKRLTEAQSESVERKVQKETRLEGRQDRQAKDRETLVLAELAELVDAEGKTKLVKLRQRCTTIATGGTFQRIIARLENQGVIRQEETAKGHWVVYTPENTVDCSFSYNLED